MRVEVPTLKSWKPLLLRGLTCVRVPPLFAQAAYIGNSPDGNGKEAGNCMGILANGIRMPSLCQHPLWLTGLDGMRFSNRYVSP